MLKEFNSYLRPFIGSTKDPNIHDLFTLRNPTSELWSELTSFGSDYDSFRELWNKHDRGEKITPEYFEKYRAYISQAEKYFFSGKNIEGSAAALSYFYSFENLVKAYLLLRKPQIMSQKLFHGLKRTETSPEPVCYSAGHGVFPFFYHEAVGTLIGERSLFLQDLLSRVTDIGYQYGQVFKNNGSAMSAKVRVLSLNREKIESVIALAVPKNIIDLDLLKNTKFSKIFKLDEFTNSDMSDRGQHIRNVFELDYRSLSYYDFYITKYRLSFQYTQEAIETARQIFFTALKGLFTEVTSKSSNDLIFSLPVLTKDDELFYMPEEAAIYSGMFLVSELVRYHPDYIIEIGKTRLKWLVDDFTHTVPDRFLRVMRNQIIQNSVSMSQY